MPQEVTESPISGTLRFSRAVSLQPLFAARDCQRFPVEKEEALYYNCIVNLNQHPLLPMSGRIEEISCEPVFYAQEKHLLGVLFLCRLTALLSCLFLRKNKFGTETLDIDAFFAGGIPV